MIKAFQNLVKNVGVEVRTPCKCDSLHPAKSNWQKRELERIARGFSSKMIVINEKLEFVNDQLITCFLPSLFILAACLAILSISSILFPARGKNQVAKAYREKKKKTNSF
jgi:hypothetical protein